MCYVVKLGTAGFQDVCNCDGFTDAYEFAAASLYLSAETALYIRWPSVLRASRMYTANLHVFMSS